MRYSYFVYPARTASLPWPTTGAAVSKATPRSKGNRVIGLRTPEGEVIVGRRRVWHRVCTLGCVTVAGGQRRPVPPRPFGGNDYASVEPTGLRPPHRPRLYHHRRAARRLDHRLVLLVRPRPGGAHQSEHLVLAERAVPDRAHFHADRVLPGPH